MLIKYNNSLLSFTSTLNNDYIYTFSFTDSHNYFIVDMNSYGINFSITNYTEALLEWGSPVIVVYVYWKSKYSNLIALNFKKHKKFYNLFLSLQYNYGKHAK